MVLFQKIFTCKTYIKFVLFSASVVLLFPFFVHASATINYPTNNLGMVGYWTFNGPDMLTNVRDGSGNGNHGSLIGQAATTTVAGKMGQALQFDGVNDYVNLPKTILPGLSAVTVSAWYKPFDTSANYDYFFQQAGGDLDPVVMAFSTGGGGNSKRFECNIGTGGVNTNTGVGNTQFSDTNWHHVVCVYNGTDIRLYVDNVLDVTPVAKTGTLDTSTNNLTIGYPYGSRKANIDDVRIYNRALSATEITALYNLGAGGRVGVAGKTTKVNSSQNTKITSGLVGLWSFDGKDVPWTSSTAGTAIDGSGNGNTGTLTNMNQATAPVIGKMGQGLKFDGVDDAVNLGEVKRNLTSLTGSIWVKFGRDGSTEYLFGKFNDATAGWVLYRAGAGDKKVYWYVWNTSFAFATVATPSAIPTNEWHHFTGVYDGAYIYLYMDGVSVGTPAALTGTIDTNGPVCIGAYSPARVNCDGGPTKGMFDDARMYDRALSASEILQLYNLGR